MLGRASWGVVVALSFGACTAQGPTLNVQAEQMELALVECKAQLGLSGQLKTEVSFDGGVPSAKAVPFDKITQADAAQINACGAGARPLDDGLLVVPMTSTLPQEVKPAALPTQTVAAAPAVHTQVTHSDACPVGVTGMYAGTLLYSGHGN